MAVDALVLARLLDKTSGADVQALRNVEVLPDSDAAHDAVVSALSAVEASLIAQVTVLVDCVVEARCCTLSDTGVILAVRKPS